MIYFGMIGKERKDSIHLRIKMANDAIFARIENGYEFD